MPTQVSEDFATEWTGLRSHLMNADVLQAKSILFFSELKVSKCILKRNRLFREKARKEEIENIDTFFIQVSVQIHN